jgi:hypothetical protein
MDDISDNTARSSGGGEQENGGESLRDLFESGDQDYGSAAGWDPVREQREQLLAESKKKYPREYAPVPEMLYVRPVQDFVESGSRDGPMKQLFGPFWLLEEVAVLFGPTGLGKSALAVQIAESLARGVPIAPFDSPQPGCEVPPQRVLYLDFELTRLQFAQRYTTTSDDGLTCEDPYQFSPDLMRAELYWDGKLIDGYEDFTDMIFEDIDRRIDEHEAEVLICDNITFLSQSSTANASIAFRLMNRLQALKKERFMSILAVAHTPKRLPHLPLTENDLQGSVDLAKVADSMFAIGRSSSGNGRGPELRYIKHVKSRTGRIEHGEDNVAVYALQKFDFARRSNAGEGTVRAENFLGFDFIGLDLEAKHLALPPGRTASRTRKRRSIDLKRVAYARQLAGQGLSSAEIAARLGVGKTTAYRYVTAGRGQGGQVERSI